MIKLLKQNYTIMLFTHKKTPNQTNQTTKKQQNKQKPKSQKEKRSKDFKLKSIPIIGKQTSLKLQNIYMPCTLLIWYSVLTVLSTGSSAWDKIYRWTLQIMFQLIVLQLAFMELYFLTLLNGSYITLLRSSEFQKGWKPDLPAEFTRWAKGKRFECLQCWNEVILGFLWKRWKEDLCFLARE